MIFKQSWKKFQKRGWQIKSKVIEYESCPQRGTRRGRWKKMKKTLRKCLTKAKRRDIITESPKKRRTKGRQPVIENWTTRDKYKAKESAMKNLDQFYQENTTQTKVKELQKLENRLKRSRERFNTIFSRVWSWLRMNAGGVHNTFKSNGVKLINPSGSVDLT